jgi:putative ABC transport system permease protein
MMRFYRALLHIYPSSFRAAYGEEMLDLFAARRRRAEGVAAITRLWLGTVFEIMGNAAAAHWEILKQDLRYAGRALRHTPGFALAAVLVVALGVGANTAVFSLADFVLLRPLPYSHPDRLVKIWERVPGYNRMELSPADYRDWKRMSNSFEAMGASRGLSANMIAGHEPLRVEGAYLTAELWPMLGLQPMIGRYFTAEEDRYGAPATLLLSYALWQSQFGGDRSVVGQKIRLDNKPYMIIGVMPPSFQFPNREAELWAAMQFQDEDFQDRNDNYLHVWAQLKAGVTLQQARADLAMVTGQLKQQYPKENGKTEANIYFLRDDFSRGWRMAMLALMGAAGCVLLIACANLMNLLLARSLVRQRELAVRTAIGAGWKRLLRQMLTESMVLAAIGGVLGVLLAIAVLPLFARLVPDSLPISATPSIDLRVLAFSLLLTTLTGIGFGLLPALRSCRNVDFGGLREGSRTGGGKKERLRSTLVVVEMTASVVLLISAGLLIRALWRIQAIDPGFRTEGVLTLRTALPMPKYEKTALRDEFYRHVLSQVRRLPGVSNAAYISFLPMAMGGGIWPVSVGGDVKERSDLHTASARFVTTGFFATMGIPLLAGRDVSESDTIDQPFAAVVSASFVQRYWPGQDALGKHFKFVLHDRVVVGVVNDIRVRGFEESSEPQVYMASKQMPDNEVIWYAPKDLVVASTAGPAALLPAIRRTVRDADPGQPVSNVETMSEIIAGQTASRSLIVKVLGAFAVVAFLLAGIGIHGLLSFAVSQRRQEIGVRIALGAQPSDIMRMVLGRSAVLAILGISAGLVLSYAAGRAMESLLAGVKPADPTTFLAAICLCLLMALVGSLAPAIKAVRVDPISAIRIE